jgi:hypothetical protein
MALQGITHEHNILINRHVEMLEKNADYANRYEAEARTLAGKAHEGPWRFRTGHHQAGDP